MTEKDITRLRLFSQQIAGTKFKKPVELISWLVGIQAQDFEGAKWAIGLRLPGITKTDVERAIAAKEIVRTWPMRSTLHIVAGADIRWLLKLLAPRFIAGNKAREKQLELDETVFKKSLEILARALEGGKQLTREELTAVFGKYDIDAKGPRLAHIIQRAGLERLICFGIKRGSEFTYTLLDEWVPPSKQLGREEALAEIAKRYFKSRGPAMLVDFIWWTGLTAADARAGLEAAKAELNQETIGGQTYWMAQDMPAKKESAQQVYLLPPFDEYLLGYKDRSLYFDSKQYEKIIQKNGIFSPVILVNGRAEGTWKRTFKKETVIIETALFKPADEAVKQAIQNEALRYAGFVGSKCSLLLH